MNEDIKLSIIIPTFNSLSSIKLLLDSIPKRNDIEIIIVDDNSTEQVGDYLNILRDEEKKFPNFMFYTNNHGTQSAGACRNIGIEHASGKWVTFADSDDFFVPGFYDIMSSQFNDKADLIYFFQTSIDVSTGKESKRHLLYNNTLKEFLKNEKSKYREVQLRYKTNSPVGKMIRLSMIKEYGIYFDETIVSNDELFSTKCGYFSNRVKVCPNVVYCITSRPGSLITNISEERFWVRLEVFIRKYLFLKEKLSKHDFNLTDLSAQEKLFSLFQNNYSYKFRKKVFKELINNKIRFITLRTFNPLVLLSKISLVHDLRNIRKAEEYFLTK